MKLFNRDKAETKTVEWRPDVAAALFNEQGKKKVHGWDKSVRALEDELRETETVSALAFATLHGKSDEIGGILAVTNERILHVASVLGTKNVTVYGKNRLTGVSASTMSLKISGELKIEMSGDDVTFNMVNDEIDSVRRAIQDLIE